MKPHLQTSIWMLLKGGAIQREIERITGISRHTIRSYQQRFAADPANCPGVATGSPSQTAPPWPPTGLTVSPPVATPRCEPHRTFIDAQLRLGRNATAIHPVSITARKTSICRNRNFISVMEEAYAT